MKKSSRSIYSNNNNFSLHQSNPFLDESAQQSSSSRSSSRGSSNSRGNIVETRVLDLDLPRSPLVRNPPRSYGGGSTESHSSRGSSTDSMDDDAPTQMFFSRGEFDAAETGAAEMAQSHRRIPSFLINHSPFEKSSNQLVWEGMPESSGAEGNITGEINSNNNNGDDNETSSSQLQGERMNYGVVEDPRNYIINMIIDSPTGNVELNDIYTHLNWEMYYEKVYGTVAEYLQGYHSIFVVSPIYDRVTLCRPVISSLQKKSRRHQRSKRQTTGEWLTAHIGSISCCCIAEEVNIEELQSLYHRRGYQVDIKYNVLHVYSKNVFDLFIFENGVVVWWGMNRRDHWIVEDDFLSARRSPAFKSLKAPFAAGDVDALFPDWSSYEIDSSYLPLKVDGKASERFSKMLCFDHYRIPAMEPDRTDVMLTVSYCIGRSASVDYYEHVTQSLHRKVLSIPLEFSGILEYFSTQAIVRRLEGELQVTQLALTTLKDTPDFLWEMPWLETFYELTEAQCTANERLSWFCARGDALLEKLSSIKNRRFRLFMLGSDVFLIGLLVFDVFFMTARLIVKLYFKVEE